MIVYPPLSHCLETVPLVDIVNVMLTRILSVTILCCFLYYYFNSLLFFTIYHKQGHHHLIFFYFISSTRGIFIHKSRKNCGLPSQIFFIFIVCLLKLTIVLLKLLLFIFILIFLYFNVACPFAIFFSVRFFFVNRLKFLENSFCRLFQFS